MEKNVQADIGVIGLAVMGQNLVLNLHDHGFSVSVHNRTASKTEEFASQVPEPKKIFPFHNLKEFVASIKRPRPILLMVKAGEVVDQWIDSLIPYLEAGDIIIDGGNSYFHDTAKRIQKLEQHNIFYVGMGVSGGEEGARFGPSLMPGGHLKAWKILEPMMKAISAKVGNFDCCTWIGNQGAGHFVKMVHNGIEYADMQLICEIYDLATKGLGISCDQLALTFESWNKTELSSYLIEITAEILKVKDADGAPLVEKIRDVAGQKGTGKWTVNSGLDLGQPLSLISEAVFARTLSGFSKLREDLHQVFTYNVQKLDGIEVEDLQKALLAAKVISYTQGFSMLKAADEQWNFGLNLAEVASIWRGGCIIRSQFLNFITQAYEADPKLASLMLAPYFKEILNKTHTSLRKVVAACAIKGIPAACLSSALSYFDSMRSSRLPANLLQAQRDYFGAHLYERIDTPQGQFFHTDWARTGSNCVSTAYNA